MRNEMKVFESNEFGNVGVIEIGNKQYFMANGIAKALGYSNTSKAINDHCRYVTKRYIPHPQNKDKSIEANFISEGDVYRLIVRSKLPSAERFEKWVFDEILPTIRKHGVYMTPETIEKTLTNPDFIIQLATQLKEEQQARRELEVQNTQQKQIIGELKPKADYVDMILKSHSLVTVTQIAKDYGMSGQAMNDLLHRKGVQYKQSGQWLLYSKYHSSGYTHSETYDYNGTNGDIKTKMSTKWTQKGRLFIYELLKKDDIIPVIEQGE